MQLGNSELHTYVWGRYENQTPANWPIFISNNGFPPKVSYVRRNWIWRRKKNPKNEKERRKSFVRPLLLKVTATRVTDITSCRTEYAGDRWCNDDSMNDVVVYRRTKWDCVCIIDDDDGIKYYITIVLYCRTKWDCLNIMLKIMMMATLFERSGVRPLFIVERSFGGVRLAVVIAVWVYQRGLKNSRNKS